ncbi:Z1 domain-containing protein [Lysinibacillus capsici]|uniref:Z1 domain-containing protein n=1 Tax=Lysinibacillus capsici TaxID=2115968 RepID=UPI00289DE103|nr:Z1 domain-containing protein [Lysinibacillus capsici]
MTFNKIKYSQLFQIIENQFNNLADWNKVRNFESLADLSEDRALEALRMFSNLSNEELNINIWNQIIDYFENREKKHKVVKLGKDTFNDAKIPVDKYSAWQLYKNVLIKQDWSEDSIKNIEKSSFEILKNLSMDTVESGPIKGLVVGNVQSGKTANMAGLMAMAADNGFNYFIILSGVIENLRQQTANRLYGDMNTAGNGHLHWHQVDNPSLRSKLPEHNISNFNLDTSAKDRYFTVCLKNSTRLNSLIKWLYDDVNKTKQLKILVIDDEADQASVNTKKIEEEDRTEINKLILKLVNSDKVKGMNYIAYTATPYANILNETGEDTLYPKDFIVLLEPSEDYIGPKQIFGTEEPEMSPYIDIVRDITSADAENIRGAQKVNQDVPLVNSLVDSLHWFMLTVAAMRAIDYRKPISMLIHTSFRISDHRSIAQKIEEYLRDFKINYKKIMPQLKVMYENESLDFKRSYFLEGMKEYSTKDEVPDYPEWEEVSRYIERMIRLDMDEFISHIPIGEEGQPKYHKGFHLVIDNSKAKAENQIVRLVYPKVKAMNPAPAFIVIGGNTLSRGLTLEGLTTTYFLRTTNQADTLMQMARWFGYRKGYEIFPRIWLDSEALERYQFLSQMNEELREEIALYAQNGLTPTTYAPRVKNSINHKLIRITSSNKMQSAEPSEYDFAGFNSQTVYFENNEDVLGHNLEHTKKFLNGLKSPKIKNSNMIWRNIPVEDIKFFLEGYYVCENDVKMSNLPALIEWAEKNSGELSNWNITLSSIGKVEDTQGMCSDWNIHGYSPKSIVRTKLEKRSTEKIANIGALRTPSDLLADIDEELTSEERNTSKILEIRSIREKYGYGKVPLITIYRIDKGQIDKASNNKNKKVSANREPLNFSKDVIGINVMIPGVSKGSQLATYISAKLNLKEINDENYYEELDDYED